MYVCAYICVYRYVRNIYIYIYIYIHTHIYTRQQMTRKCNCNFALKIIQQFRLLALIL